MQTSQSGTANPCSNHPLASLPHMQTNSRLLSVQAAELQPLQPQQLKPAEKVLKNNSCAYEISVQEEYSHFLICK